MKLPKQIKFLLLFCLNMKIVAGIKCYHCNSKENVTCPGYDSPPIDSVVDKSDVVGLYDHCVTIRYENDTIIEQGIYPGSTHCQEIFLQSWTKLLNSKSPEQKVIIECCSEDLCNAPAGHAHAWSQATTTIFPIFSLSLCLMIASSM